MKICFQVEGVWFRYGRRKPWLFESFSWKVQEGEVWWIRGPNGVGKSTLLKLIVGILRPKQGRILWDTYCKKRRAVLLDVPGFLPDLPVWHQIFLYAEMLGVPQERAEYALREAQINPQYWNYRFSRLSQGYQQRIRLALLHLLPEPCVIMVDEPLRDLDPVSIELFQRWIHTWYNAGVTLILAGQHLAPIQKVIQTGYVLELLPPEASERVRITRLV